MIPERETELEHLSPDEAEWVRSQDEWAVWQCDVDECPDCQAQEGEEVCCDHDLNDPDVARKYSLGR